MPPSDLPGPSQFSTSWYRRARRLGAVMVFLALVSMALANCATRGDTQTPTADRPTLPAGPDGKLLAAAAFGDIFRIEDLLNEGADVNARASNGTTALMGAAYGEYPRTAEYLLARGADVNAKSADGLTPLHYAAGAGNTVVVGILLKAGADPNGRSIDGTTPLMRAAGAGREDTVKRLVAGGADINITANDGATALSLARDAGYSNIVASLNAAGNAR